MESRFALVGRASVRIWHPAPPPRRGPDAFPATKAAADAAFAARRPSLSAAAGLAAFALALWPHWRWAAARLGDGSDDPLGLAALALLVSRSPASRRACAPSRRRVGSRSRCCSPRSPPCSAWLAPPLLAALLAALAFAAALAAFAARGDAGAAARRPGDAGAAGGLVAAVLRRLPAAASSPPRRAAGCCARRLRRRRAKAARCASTATW